MINHQSLVCELHNVSVVVQDKVQDVVILIGIPDVLKLVADAMVEDFSRSLSTKSEALSTRLSRGDANVFMLNDFMLLVYRHGKTRSRMRRCAGRSIQ